MRLKRDMGKNKTKMITGVWTCEKRGKKGSGKHKSGRI